MLCINFFYIQNRLCSQVHKPILNWKQAHAPKHMLASTTRNRSFLVDAHWAPGVCQPLIHVQPFLASALFKPNQSTGREAVLDKVARYTNREQHEVKKTYWFWLDVHWDLSRQPMKDVENAEINVFSFDMLMMVVSIMEVFLLFLPQMSATN